MKRLQPIALVALIALALYDHAPGVIAQGRQLLFPRGTPSRPGLAVDGEPRTGVYMNDNSELAVAVRGEEVAKFNGSGLAGLGTANQMPKFGADGSLTDSQVQDNGSAVTVNAVDFNANAEFVVNLTGADMTGQFTGTLDLIAGPSPGPVDFFMFKPAAGTSGSMAELSGRFNASDGSDTLRGFFVNLTNATHTGASNTVRGVDIDTITGSANAIETALNIGSGWDVGVTLPSVLQANLVAAGNGSMVYCSDCNPDATCTGAGAGAVAFRINGAWACELN